MNVSERFWSKVERSDECWEWKGARFPAGYGIFSTSHGRSGVSQRAHRAAWQLSYGPIPPGLVVCHRCDNPPCVRPDHLFLGTNATNQRDMTKKGRGRNGTRNGRALLTETAIPEIRRRRALGESTRAIAADFGVSPGAIWFITTGKHWKHVA